MIIFTTPKKYFFALTVNLFQSGGPLQVWVDLYIIMMMIVLALALAVAVAVAVMMIMMITIIMNVVMIMIVGKYYITFSKFAYSWTCICTIVSLGPSTLF